MHVLESYLQLYTIHFSNRGGVFTSSKSISNSDGTSISWEKGDASRMSVKSKSFVNPIPESPEFCFECDISGTVRNGVFGLALMLGVSIWFSFGEFSMVIQIWGPHWNGWADPSCRCFVLNWTFPFKSSGCVSPSLSVCNPCWKKLRLVTISSNFLCQKGLYRTLWTDWVQ